MENTPKGSAEENIPEAKQERSCRQKQLNESSRKRSGSGPQPFTEDTGGRERLEALAGPRTHGATHTAAASVPPHASAAESLCCPQGWAPTAHAGPRILPNTEPGPVCAGADENHAATKAAGNLPASEWS